jgi:hypothetical protein
MITRYSESLLDGHAGARSPVTGRHHRRLPSLATRLTLVCCCFSASGVASADLRLPPGHGVFTGLSGGSYSAFESEVGKHAAVNGVFVTWGRTFEGAFGEAHFNHARLMLHISTAQGYGAPEQITPRGIAQGAGDGYLLSLSKGPRTTADVLRHCTPLLHVLRSSKSAGPLHAGSTTPTS